MCVREGGEGGRELWNGKMRGVTWAGHDARATGSLARAREEARATGSLAHNAASVLGEWLCVKIDGGMHNSSQEQRDGWECG